LEALGVDTSPESKLLDWGVCANPGVIAPDFSHSSIGVVPNSNRIDQGSWATRQILQREEQDMDIINNRGKKIGSLTNAVSNDHSITIN
jgi:hypothetical protein